MSGVSGLQATKNALLVALTTSASQQRQIEGLRDIVNGKGISQRLGESRPTIANWRERYADFPKPLDMPGVLGIPLYSWPAVKDWYHNHFPERNT